MIWAKEETLPREEIERIQLTKLKDTVRYIYDRVKPYREKMDMAGVRPEDIQTLEDLKNCRLHIKLIFGIIIRMGCLRLIKRKSFVIMQVRVRRESRPLSDIQETIWISGWIMLRELHAWEARRKKMWHRSRLDTEHLRERSTSRRSWEDRSICDSDVFRKYKQTDYVFTGYGCDTSCGYRLMRSILERNFAEEGSIHQKI